MNYWVLVILAVNLSAYAVKGPQPSETTQNAQVIINPSNDAKLLGVAELRPSYKSLSGEFHSENSAVLGYQFNKNDSLVYKQEFNTNIYDPKLDQSKSGVNGYLVDGYLKEKLNNIYSNGNFSMSYEGRQYLPTMENKRQVGMITSIRNYAKLKYQASPSLALTMEEVPVLHLYQRSGFESLKGATANPIFENRSSFGAEYAFSDKLKLIVPVLLSNVRTRAYSQNALNNEKWLHKIWINPEIYYSLNSNITVGAAFYSENLIKNNNFVDASISEGFEQGTTQLIFSTNL